MHFKRAPCEEDEILATSYDYFYADEAKPKPAVKGNINQFCNYEMKPNNTRRVYFSTVKINPYTFLISGE